MPDRGQILEPSAPPARELRPRHLLDAVAYRWPRLARIIKARPRRLIEDGEVNPRVMRRELMTREEVLSQLRLHGIDDAGRVKLAYLEPNGLISIVRRDGKATEPVEPPATR